MRRYPLWALVLVPIVLLAPVAAATQVLTEVSVGSQLRLLATQRADSVLAGIEQRVTERRRTQEIFAQLLADRPGVPEHVEASDAAGLVRVLEAEARRLGLDLVVAYGPSGAEIVQFGGDLPGRAPGPTPNPTGGGLTTSGVVVTESGLAIAAAAPVHGPSGVVGGLLVSTTLDARALQEIGQWQGVILALLREGEPVLSTTAGDEVWRWSGQVAESPSPLAHTVAEIDSQPYAVAVAPLGGGSSLVAFVPTADLAAASAERRRKQTSGTLALTSVLALVGLALARMVSRPLGLAVAATRDLLHGDYGRRLGPSPIAEVDAMSQAINHLAAELEQKLALLSYQASHDGLTGLPNRMLFHDRLEHSLARATRQHVGIAVLFVDLDDFKTINDSLGHHAGDVVLAEVAHRLQGRVRASDTVARLGGDEFAVLLEDVASAERASTVAEDLLAALEPPIWVEHRAVYVRASIGIALPAGNETDSTRHLLANADAALYRAKDLGKGRPQVFVPGMREPTSDRLASAELPIARR